jgi:glycine cleavage system H lipoate-binding protein
MLFHLTGKVRFNNLKKPGETISKDDLMAVIENQGKMLSIFSPVSGKIIDLNPILTDNPGMINEDPYRKGWMYKVRPNKWIAETSKYHLAGDAAEWMGQELARFKDFLMKNSTDITSETPGIILQDGGELRDHILSELPKEIWCKFQEDFLNRTDGRGN